MTCDDVAKIINAWEETGAAVPLVCREVSAHADTCGSCRERYAGILILMERDAGVRDSIGIDSAADGSLVSGVMDRVLAAGRRGKVVHLPRGIQIAAAAVLVAAFGFLLVLNLYLRPTVVVEFSLEAPSADSVHLVGDFNRWDPSRVELKDPEGDGIWSAKIRLKRGTIYSYNFVIDEDRWIADPESLFNVDDGFGGVNSMIKL